MDDDDLTSLHGVSSRPSDSGYASTARARKRSRARSSTLSVSSVAIGAASSRRLNARMDALTKQMENVCKATEGGNRANAGTSLGIVRKSIVRKPQRSELGGIEGHAAKRKDSVGRADQGERPVLKRRRTPPIHSQPSQQRSKSYDTQLNRPEDEDLASPLQLVRVLSPSGAGAMRTKVKAKRAPRRHGGSQRSSPLQLPFWMRGEQPTAHCPSSPSPTPPWLINYLAPPASHLSVSARASSSRADPTALSLGDSSSQGLAISSSSTIQPFPDTLYDSPPSPLDAASAPTSQAVPSTASAAPLPFSTSGRAVCQAAPPPRPSVHSSKKSFNELQMARQRYAVQLTSSPLFGDDPAAIFAATDRCPPSRVDSTYNPVPYFERAARDHSPSAFSMQQSRIRFLRPTVQSSPPAAAPFLRAPSFSYAPADQQCQSLHHPVSSSPGSCTDLFEPCVPSVSQAQQGHSSWEATPAPSAGFWKRRPQLPPLQQQAQSSPYLKGKQRYAESLRQEAAHFFDSKSPFLPPFTKPTHDVFGPTLSLPSAAVAASAFPKRAASVEPPLQQVEYHAPYQDQNVPPLPLESSVWGVSPLPRPQPRPFAAATPPPRHDLDRKVLPQTPPPPFNHPASHVANVHHKVLVPDSPSPPPLQPSANQPGPKGISSPSREKPALPERKVDAGEERPGKGWNFVAQAGELASFLVQAAQEMESCGKAEEARQEFEIFRDQAEEENPIEEA